MTNDFSQWVLKEIDLRGWTYQDVAKRGGVSRARVSQVINGETPGKGFCRAIARAFNLPPEEVFRRAGLLPPAPPRTPGLVEVEHLFLMLSPEQRALLLATMRAWVNADPIADDVEI